MEKQDRTEMVLFWYSGTNHTICINAKSSYQRFNLKGGIWRQKGNRYFYPLNGENIEILFKDHPDGKTDRYNEYRWVWKYSLWEAIYKYLGNRVKKSADMLFLNKLKIDNVSRFPKLYIKEGMPEPFKNQHISQFWQQKTDYHAYLWEMGPLVGNTLIITDNGIKKIKDYTGELVANPEGVHTASGTVKKFAEKTIKVKTYHGYSIEGTPEHEILTTKGTKTFSELSEDDELLIGSPDLYGKYHIEKDYAIALGFFVAEGHYDNPQIEFRISGQEDMIERIERCLKPKGHTTRTRNGCKSYRAWFKRLMPEIENKYYFKQVPEIILRSDKETQINFLYGYFRGDGSLRWANENISFKLTERDEQLVDQVQLMLANMGILSKKYEYKEVDVYNLTVGNDYTNKMIDIGLIDGNINIKPYRRNSNGKQYKFQDNMLVSKIISIEHKNHNDYVYCLAMNNEKHLFFGNGIAVHNTGKTRAGVEGFEIKHRQGKVDHLLVICPVSMLDKWVVEIEKWGHEGIQAAPLKGTRQEKLDLLKMNFDAVVVNFETCALIIDELLAVVNERWMIICDETTKIKNPRANRTKAVLDLGLRTEYKAILTGTPITQHAYDVFSQYAFLDSGKTFGLNYDAFLDKYFWKQGFKFISKGQWALDEVSDKMFKSSTRFLKKDCIDIPDKMYDNRILTLPAYNQEKYKEMVKYAITQIEGSEHVTAAIILTQLLRLSQITSGFVVDEHGKEVNFDENPKLDALRDILEESNSSKVVIWARFRQDVRNISKLCEELKIKYVQMYGDINNDQRTRNVAQFQDDADTKVIIGTASTGGHGIDLVAGTIVVYFSNSYSLEQRLQSEDRTHRAGQRNQVTYIDLLCKDTIDITIYKVLRSKKSVADIVTRDYRSFMGG